MKVIDIDFGGLEPGTKVDLAATGLPVKGDKGVLIVFWKTR